MRKILLALVVAFSLYAGTSIAQTLPSTYTQTTVVSGLYYPVDFDWTSDGRYFITQKGGYTGAAVNAKIQVYSSTGTFLSTFADLTDSITCGGERGVLGIAIDPNFSTNHYVYAYYVYKYGTANQIRVVRWTEVSNVGTSPTTIMSLNLNTLGFTPQPYHYAGIIRFRPSQPDKLYIMVGEMYHNQTDTTAGQNFGQMKNKPYGKILRINTDGTIPTDNPFYDDGNPLTGNDDRIWSYGHRNMFGLCFNTVTDSMYESENGLTTWDEFNIIHKGANYGWNHCEGFYENSSTTVLCTEPGFTAPLASWAAPLPALTGCLYYNGTAMPEFNNHILVADNDYGRIYDLTMGNAPAYDIVTSKVTFADVVSGSEGITTMRQGTDGCIYAMKGGYTTTGTIFRICHASGVGIAVNEKFENSIGQNYPNPSTGNTEIDFSVSDASKVTIDLYDVTGRKIKTIMNASREPGEHTVEVSGLDKFADGSYFYKIVIEQNGKVVYSASKRLMIVK
jgi:aldose sugar dehydrogenase